eukprot:CAMPEP_0118942920 /NCGR_PEP_ID=MMETSP1169-20130426/37163_1 /TAXON_ID=36882 /ORGANISM="Pyramimonas obovata, Strain CCMP722" /LENGTH=273 /DNA_ID=CAMNT_0006888037 /DNA_START=169 /DNA_END=986 /DNA_ORIENTATION=+
MPLRSGLWWLFLVVFLCTPLDIFAKVARPQKKAVAKKLPDEVLVYNAKKERAVAEDLTHKLLARPAPVDKDAEQRARAEAVTHELLERHSSNNAASTHVTRPDDPVPYAERGVVENLLAKALGEDVPDILPPQEPEEEEVPTESPTALAELPFGGWNLPKNGTGAVTAKYGYIPEGAIELPPPPPVISTSFVDMVQNFTHHMVEEGEKDISKLNISYPIREALLKTDHDSDEAATLLAEEKLVRDTVYAKMDAKEAGAKQQALLAEGRKRKVG